MLRKDLSIGAVGFSEMRLDLDVDFAVIIVGILNKGQNVEAVGAQGLRPLMFRNVSQMSEVCWLSGGGRNALRPYESEMLR